VFQRVNRANDSCVNVAFHIVEALPCSLRISDEGLPEFVESVVAEREISPLDVELRNKALGIDLLVQELVPHVGIQIDNPVIHSLNPPCHGRRCARGRKLYQFADPFACSKAIDLQPKVLRKDVGFQIQGCRLHVDRAGLEFLQ
jgi:hypothetical protein